MTRRYADAQALASANRDFVIRRRFPSLWFIAFIFFVGFISLVLVALHFGKTAADSPAFLAFVASTVGFLTWFAIYFTQRGRDLVLATEFQNALFAGAAGLNTRFCLITKKDGTIVYYDPGFQSMFYDFLARNEHRMIDTLLDVARVSNEDSDRIFVALQQGKYEKLIFTLTGSDGKQNKIMLTIDPLPRPQGFFLFRGRTYVERESDRLHNSADADTRAVMAAPSLFAHLMHHAPVGLYTANNAGELQFINRTLEYWLGYEPGEMLSRRMVWQDLIYEMDHKLMGHATTAPADFDGEVTLQKKNGSLLKAALYQQVLRDVGGQALGASAIITSDQGKK